MSAVAIAEIGTTGHDLDPNGVNHPRHYNTHASGIEAIDVARFMSFNVGNAYKYLYRADHKGNRQQDVAKALWYIRDEVENGEPLARKWNDKTWSAFCKVFATEPDPLVRMAFSCMAEYTQHASQVGLMKALHVVTLIKAALA